MLFTGFQAAGTRGQKIVNGSRTIKIHGQEIPIGAEVKNLDNLSAHADQNELLLWAQGFSQAPKKVFITHGEQSASESLRDSLTKNLGWSCLIPDYQEEHEL